MSDERLPPTALGLRRPAPAVPRPQLCVLLECDRPLAPSTRHALSGVGEVVLRRGPHRSALRSGTELIVSIADQWLSGTHARLVREGDGFLVFDANSTNGTWVDGRQVPSEGLRLHDGDVFEIGHTLLLFRAAALEGAPSAPADLDGAQLDPGHTGLVTLSSSLLAEHERLAAIARSTAPVVINGEPGSGKELAARALHALSGREGPFVAVDCGAFSGAAEEWPRLLRSAHHGTLLLADLDELPLQEQAALHRLLEAGEVLPVGASQAFKFDVRLVADTRRDLSSLAREGQLRGDLLSRLEGSAVRVPPLRERPEDLGLLVAALLKKVARDAAAHVQLTCEAGRALARYRWPLNVPELEQCLRTTLAAAGTQTIELWHLPKAVRAALREGSPTDARVDPG